jgi:PBP1b-binding outer membrane lipoprotein LpoB
MKMKLQKYFLLVMLAVFLSGCTAYTHFYNDDANVPAPTAPNQVRVYSVTKISGNYFELGSVAVHIPKECKGDELKMEIKKEAAKMGADAVIDFTIVGYTAHGTAIKFK